MNSTSPASNLHEAVSPNTGSDRAFAFRMAAFAAAYFVLECVTSTWADGKYTSLVPYHDRHYRAGYWVCLGGIPLFAVVFAVLARLGREPSKAILAAIGVVIVYGGIVLASFHPPFPNIGVFLGAPSVGALVLIAALVRSVDAPTAKLGDSSIPLNVRIEWLKESLTFWRTITITGTFAFLAGAMTFAQFMSGVFARSFKSEEQQSLAEGLQGLKIWYFGVFFFFGPLCEAFRRINDLRERILDLKDTPKPARRDVSIANAACSPTDNDMLEVERGHH